MTSTDADSGTSFRKMLSPTTGSAPDPLASSVLSTSMASLSSSARASRHPSHVSKTYRQASTLFLTRRLPEALTTLASLLTPPDPAISPELADPAPVACASRTSRIKIWCLYLALLNAILELEPHDGKEAFGNQEWRALCAKVREGEVWEEVVARGYHGVEGDVDADVVINLATLLLAHARDQTQNQRRLEAYLASSSALNLNIAGKLARSSTPSSRLNSRYASPGAGVSSTNTSRDLTARVKILELFTLHVLVRNSEWEYARAFISANTVLDERREAFLHALESLRADAHEQDRLAREERQRQDEELRQQNADSRLQRRENENKERRRLDEERARREGSEVDYGIEQTPSYATSASAGRPRQSRPAQHASRPSMTRPGNKAVAPHTFLARTRIIFTRLFAALQQLSMSLQGQPALLVRLLGFFIGLLLVFGHGATKERVQRLLKEAWGKLKATAGMGTKVSYM